MVFEYSKSLLSKQKDWFNISFGGINNSIGNIEQGFSNCLTHTSKVIWFLIIWYEIKVSFKDPFRRVHTNK